LKVAWFSAIVNASFCGVFTRGREATRQTMARDREREREGKRCVFHTTLLAEYISLHHSAFYPI
jgi:hypothetical protein